jgi:hypothetical protein
MLPANVGLNWKVIARYKHSSLFGLIIAMKETSFITLTPGPNYLKELKIPFKIEIFWLKFTNISLLSLYA